MRTQRRALGQSSRKLDLQPRSRNPSNGSKPAAEALPDHEIASAVDGGALKFVGVSDETILGSRDRLDIAMPSNADSLAVAEEIDSDGILRDAVRHTGDLSRKQLHDLTIGEELEGKIVSLELYHGALVDCG